MRKVISMNSTVAFCAVLLFFFSASAWGQSDTESSDGGVLSKLQSEIFALEEKIGALLGRQEELEHQLRRLQEEGGVAPDGAPADGGGLSDRVKSLEELNADGRLQRLESEGILERLKKLEQAVAEGARDKAQAAAETPEPPREVDAEEASDENTVLEVYQAAFSQLTKRQYAVAEASFKSFLKSYSEHPLAANAAYWLGESYYVRNNYEASAKQFLQTYNDYPEGGKRFDSLLKLAFSLRALGATNEACQALSELLNPANDPQKRLSENIRERAGKERESLGCQ